MQNAGEIIDSLICLILPPEKRHIDQITFIGSGGKE